MDNDSFFTQSTKADSHDNNHSQQHQHKGEKAKNDLLDSPDDFEHLVSDSSSREEANKSDVKDILGNFTSTARDFAAEINREADKAVEDIFDPLKRTALSDVPVAESNSLEMGDTVPDKRVEHKLDTFLSEFKTDSGFQQTDHHTNEGDKNHPGLFEEIKASTQNFMDFERENIPQDFANSSKGISVTGDKLDDFGVKSVLTDPIISHKIKDKEGESELHKDLLGSFSSSNIAPHLDESLKPSAPVSFEEKEKSKIIIEEKPKPAETQAEKSIKELKKSVEDVTVIEKKKNELAKKNNDFKVEKQEDNVKETKPAPEKKQHDTKTKLEAEALFCNLGLDAWFRPNQLNPKVESLIYWRDPKKSGPVFAGVLIVLLALTYFSLISVVAYLSLLILTGTISFRIYKNIVQAVQKTGDGHPFKEILEAEVGLPQDKTKEVSEVIVANLNGVLHELRRLFLVEDLIDSIKFAVLLWCMTYLGAWFNGMTLVIIAWVALYTLPKVYEMNKTQIDNNLQLVKSKLAEITSKVKAAIPIGKKEEKKDQ